MKSDSKMNRCGTRLVTFDKRPSLGTVSPMKHASKLLALAATAALFLPFGANVALAHEGGVGDGTSVTVRLDTQLPAGIEPNLGNGEAELHVEPGMTVVVYGVEGEEMLKIDEGGTAYQNMNSATWLASMEMSSEMKDNESAGMNMGAAVGGAAAMAIDPASDKADDMTGVAPDWKFLASGGALRWHDHRIHWMSGEFPKDVAIGDELMKFELPVAIDGEALTLKGALLYAGGEAPAHDETDGHSHGDNGTTGGLPTVVVLVGALLLLVGTGALLFSKSRKAG